MKSNGRKILDLMTNFDLLVVNGYIMGDIEGNYTCCPYNGLSVKDMEFAKKVCIFQSR